MLRFSLIALAAATAHVRAADFRLVPDAAALAGPADRRQLLALEFDGPAAVADRTASAKFSSSDPKVAVVEADGTLRPVGDGEAVIEARDGDRVAKSTVRVANFAKPAVPNFRNEIVPILTRAGCNSGACHGALAGKGGLKLSLRGYDPDSDHFVLTRQALSRRVDRQDPDKSLMLLKATKAMPHGGGTRIEKDSPEYRRVLDWIAGTAPGPRDDDPTLTKLEVLPSAAVLKAKGGMRFVVRATYSDGRTADVTRRARFGSSEEQVANVDEDGAVKVVGSGEAAVTVNFGSRVATAAVSVPFPNAVDPAVFKNSPRHNFIDEWVLKKLEALRLPPSPPCTDAEFIRRVFLDAAGVLPTPDEVAKFVADPAAEKRSRLVDALLDRPEFVDYWSYKWSDLLLVSTRKLPASAMWAFYRSIRRAVADDKPWDAFARDVVTASGSTLTNGAGNFFALHKDTADLTESAAVTFLGTSITCARCHNHPLEKWTQDQYWSMANLFGRVAIKNGDRAGELVIAPSPVGDVLHPRRNVAMPPTPLDGKPVELDAPGDRRAAFADWMTAPENPFFAKAVVNRVWKNFLGRGLVEAEDDLRETNPPSNRELFDALAADFVAHKYDVKRLIKQIAASAAYQRSAQALPGNKADDRFYSRYLVAGCPAK